MNERRAGATPVSRRRIVFLGGLIWTGWAFFNTLVLTLQEGVYFVFALFGSLESSYIMGLLSLGVWKLVRHLSWETPRQGVIAVVTHLLMAPVFSAVWMALYIGLNVAMFGAIIVDRMRVKEVAGWWFLSGITQYAVIAGVFHGMRLYRHIQEKATREAELQLLANRMELAQLKSQLNPHFLFNTLNSINALIGSNPEAARRMLAQLAEILRYALDSDREPMVPLRDELRFLETYLRIEQARLADRLRVTKDIVPGLLDAPVPPMLLQPLVENAVRHGISPLEHGGEITIRIYPAQHRLQFEIIDTGQGAGADPQALTDNGIGLRNTDQRLRRLFGEDSALRFEKRPGGFHVAFSIPRNEPDEAALPDRR